MNCPVEKCRCSTSFNKPVCMWHWLVLSSEVRGDFEKRGAPLSHVLAEVEKAVRMSDRDEEIENGVIKL